MGKATIKVSKLDPKICAYKRNCGQTILFSNEDTIMTIHSLELFDNKHGFLYKKVEDGYLIDGECYLQGASKMTEINKSMKEHTKDYQARYGKECVFIEEESLTL